MSRTIFLTGAGGTGKTTVGEILAEVLNLRRAPSVSRSSPFKVGTQEHQDYVGKNVYRQCMTHINHVIDRTPFDVVAYDYNFNANSLTRDKQYAEMFVRTNPTVIYFPLYWLPENDGFRPTDVELARSVDQLIKEQLDFSGLNYYTVKNERPEDRVAKILRYVDRRK